MKKLNKKAEINWLIIILIILAYLAVSFMLELAYMDSLNFQGWALLFKPGAMLLNSLGI